jgi:hypothetical protein
MCCTYVTGVGEMPRSKEGKKRTPVNEVSLKKAIEAVTSNDPEKKMSYREATKVFGISKTTLLRHVNKFKSADSPNEFHYSPNFAVKQVFTEEEEKGLVTYIKNVAHMQYGLTKKGVRLLAFKYARANDKKMPVTWSEEEIAGEEWMRGFLKRHTDLSVRKPEATSLSRITSFNRTNIGLFFNNIKEVHRKYGPFAPDKVWNLDETGLSTVQGQSKIIAPKGVKQIGSATSAERGSLVTMIAAVNAVGNSLPPMLIFPRVHFKDRMLFGGPAGCIGAANPSGWSNEVTFIKFLDHFLNSVKSSKDDRVLLILDNHETHLSPEALDKASDAGIVMVTYPPHTSHRLQPLDLTVYGPLKTYYNQAVEAWLLNNKGKTFDIYGIAEALGAAYPRAFTPSNVMSGFKKSGIFPFDEAVFTDEDFLCSYVTDRPMDASSSGPKTSSSVPTTLPNVEPSISTSASCSIVDPGPSTSSAVISHTPLSSLSSVPEPSFESVIETPNTPTRNIAHKSCLTPEEVQPYPKAEQRKKKRKSRQPGRTMIATDTPEKNAIKEQKSKRDKKKGAVTKKKPFQKTLELCLRLLKRRKLTNIRNKIKLRRQS